MSAFGGPKKNIKPGLKEGHTGNKIAATETESDRTPVGRAAREREREKLLGLGMGLGGGAEEAVEECSSRVVAWVPPNKPKKIEEQNRTRK